MAGSPASGRRSRPSPEDRQQQLILMGAAAILVIVAAVVVVGVILTWYLPPRAHVLTVGERDFNARVVADRAHYLATTGNGEAQRVPAREGTRSLIRQEVLLQVGAPLVEPVTDDEVRAAIAQRLGLPEEFTDAEYASEFQSFLQVSPIGQRELEGLIRAGLIEDRLGEQFREELPEAGDQLRLLAIPTDNRGVALALAEAVRGGADFTEAAVETGAVESEADVQDLGWFAPEALHDRVRDIVADMEAGAVTDPIDDANRIGFEVYFVAERTTDQPYEDRVRDQLARGAFTRWMQEQEDAIGVQLDLTSSSEDWIRRQVQAALRG